MYKRQHLHARYTQSAAGETISVTDHDARRSHADENKRSYTHLNGSYSSAGYVLREGRRMFFQDKNHVYVKDHFVGLSVPLLCKSSLLITAVPKVISVDEVSNRLAELQSRKASGLDGVSNIALIRLPEQGLLFLITLLNAFFRLAYFSKNGGRLRS